MKWIQTTVVTTAEGIEPLCARMGALGFEQLEILEDGAQIQAFLDQNAVNWDYIDEAEVLRSSQQPGVRLYLPDDEDGKASLKRIQDEMQALKQEDLGVQMGSLQVIDVLMDDQDWANNWKQYFKPLPIGDRLLIQPAWEELQQPTEREVIRIEVGLIFGTGQHESTQLCLEQLEKRVTGGERVLDLGCGSGILAIAALKLGAADAVAVDIDPLAKQTVADNMQMNGLTADRYRVLIGDAAGDEGLKRSLGGGYDIVLANIVADVILRLAPTASQQVKSGGLLITSGIIGERLPEIHAALRAAGFELLDTQLRNDWACVVGRKL